MPAAASTATATAVRGRRLRMVARAVAAAGIDTATAAAVQVPATLGPKKTAVVVGAGPAGALAAGAYSRSNISST